MYTREETHMEPDGMEPWKTIFLYKPVVFRLHVSVSGCTFIMSKSRIRYTALSCFAPRGPVSYIFRGSFFRLQTLPAAETILQSAQSRLNFPLFTIHNPPKRRTAASVALRAPQRGPELASGPHCLARSPFPACRKLRKCPDSMR